MSSFIVQAVDIDAMVSVATSWTRHGSLVGLPAPLREVLNVTADRATEVGRSLWQSNYDANTYGGPLEFADPEWLASDEFAELFQPMPKYTFREFEGRPSPRVALHVSGFYAYQTDGDAWREDRYRPDGRLPFPALFTFAMRAHAMALAGNGPSPEWLKTIARHPDGNTMYDVGGAWVEAEDELDHRWSDAGVQRDLPWGLEETDRDLFVRFP